MKLGSPDYVNRDSDEATEDFMRRIECYENSYESLDEDLDRWVREPRGLQLALRGWGSPLGHLRVARCGGCLRVVASQGSTPEGWCGLTTFVSFFGAEVVGQR